MSLGKFLGNAAKTIGGGLVAGIPGAIATGIGALANVRATKNNRNYNYELWKRQNEYNLPSNQMKRLQDAGINPHLAFQRGAISNVATQQAKGSDLKIDANLSQMVAYQQTQNLKAQNDLLRAQAQKAYAEADVAKGTIAPSIRGKELQTLLSEIEHTQKTFGVEKADPTIKILFSDWARRNKKVFNPETNKMEKPDDYLSQDQIQDFLRNVTITREIAKALTALGLGRMLSNRKSNIKTPKGYKGGS